MRRDCNHEFWWEGEDADNFEEGCPLCALDRRDERITELESQLSDARAEIAGLRNQIVGAGGTPDPKYGDRA